MELVGNYRGTALGYSVVKVVVRVLVRKLGRFSEDRILTEAQGRFRSQGCIKKFLSGGENLSVFIMV